MAGTVSRSDPLRDAERISGDMQQPLFAGSAPEPDFRIDVTETEDAYIVKAELPGTKKEDIDVVVNDNQVSISADLKPESGRKPGEAVIRSERRCGRHARSFALPAGIDDTRTVARYQDGVLELTLPKRPVDGRSGRIAIK